MLNVIGIPAIIALVVSLICEIVKSRVNMTYEKLFLQKQEQYNSIITFMSVVVDVKNYAHINSRFRPNSDKPDEIKKYYKEEIKIQRNYCVLFSNKEVIKAIDSFLVDPSVESENIVIEAMKNDLWRRKFRLKK